MALGCEIEFDDNPLGTFYGGQALSGKVTLSLDRPEQITAVTIDISGYAKTQWFESRESGGSDSDRRDTYEGSETYIGTKAFLLDQSQMKSGEVPMGLTAFPFFCQLPTSCPSSFEGPYGHIRYKVIVMVMAPEKPDRKFKRGFTLLTLVDLNHLPMLSAPKHSEISKTFGSDLLSIAVDVPQAGYVPGQYIPVSVLIANNSNKEVKGLQISLKMLGTYYSQRPSKHSQASSTIVSKLKGESVKQYSKKCTVYELPVPPTPPTEGNLCSLIQVAYKVKVKVLMPWLQPHLFISVPVTIGNVPLQFPTATTTKPPVGCVGDFTAADQAAPANTKEAEAAAGAEAPHLTPTTPPWEAGASNIPPPSYEEALHVPLAKINGDEDYHYSESDFVPRYPLFNIPSPTASMPNEFPKNEKELM